MPDDSSFIIIGSVLNVTGGATQNAITGLGFKIFPNCFEFLCVLHLLVVKIIFYWNLPQAKMIQFHVYDM